MDRFGGKCHAYEGRFVVLGVMLENLIHFGGEFLVMSLSRYAIAYSKSPSAFLSPINLVQYMSV
jgi:hypothetical protein